MPAACVGFAAEMHPQLCRRLSGHPAVQRPVDTASLFRLSPPLGWPALKCRLKSIKSKFRGAGKTFQGDIMGRI